MLICFIKLNFLSKKNLAVRQMSEILMGLQFSLNLQKKNDVFKMASIFIGSTG